MTHPTDHDARVLVEHLAARGGDHEAVRTTLTDLADDHNGHDLLVLALTALWVTFAECLPHPATTNHKEGAA